MNRAMIIQNQLLATKFFVPATSGPLIARPRLTALLDQSLKHPLTLVSAPAGFGKTTLLSTWAQSLPTSDPLVAWVSLDEEDNDPCLFWTYVLSALDQQDPERFTALSKSLQLSDLPLKYILGALCNLVQNSQEHMVLILDDYHLIIEQQVHITLTYLIEHLPPQLHIILATRTDPPLPLSLLRTRRQILEVRTDQLRCTLEETRAFFNEIIGSQFPLERLTASLCDAVMQQTGSQELLKRLEQANSFVVSLDSKQQWYRYHALFAEVLYHQLKQTQSGLVPLLHHRASLWYVQHHQTSEAILHAFKAEEWQRAADLIEGISLMSLRSWGASEHKLTMLQDWLEQLPADIVSSRPRLCLACTQMLWAVAPLSRLNAWFNTAQTTLTALLTMQTHEDTSPTLLTSQARQEQENLLGEVLAHRATLCSYEEDGQGALTLCQQALSLLSADNFMFRTETAVAQLWAFYHASVNDAVAAIQSGLQACSLAQTSGQLPLVLAAMGMTALHMLGTGQLHKAQQLTQQAMQLGITSEGLVLPDRGFPAIIQAAIRCEWNQLDAALSLAEEALEFTQQISSIPLLSYLLLGYAVLLHIFLSRRDYDAAYSAFQQMEHFSQRMNQPTSLFHRSFFTTVDQVRLWLACGELNRAMSWAKELDLRERHGTPLAHEREEVACARILLAKQQPDLALQRLEPVLQRATTGRRWGHVIEIRLLQALAYQMRHQEAQALDALSQAVRLAEPEGYIRSFVDEGSPMETLLSRLRHQQRPHGSTPYLDILLAAFPQRSKVPKRQYKERGQTKLP